MVRIERQSTLFGVYSICWYKVHYITKGTTTKIKEELLSLRHLTNDG